MMVHVRTACEPELISAFLSDEISPAQLERLESHLNVCEWCQSQFNECLSSLDVSEKISALQKDGDEVNNCGRANDSDLLRHFAAKFFPAKPDEELLGRIDQFELEEPIGSGGMGLVYKAFDRPLHRYVAIKVLSPTIATAGAAKQRFVREAQAAAAIHSPHVVPIYAVAEFDGLPYIVMHYCVGRNLQDYLNAVGPLAISNALRITHQIALGLTAAHQQGVIHRDVKPANILLEPSIWQASLTDFGLALVANDASLTQSGMTPGTPGYMSPEQASGAAVDPRSDWYSLGCVLYAMLVGHPPFRGKNAYEILTRLHAEDIKRPSHHRTEIPAWLDKLTLMLLHKDPNERLSNSSRICKLVNDSLLHAENPGVNALPAELLPKRKVHRWILAATFLAIAAVVLSLVNSRSNDALGSNRQLDGDSSATDEENLTDDVSIASVEQAAMSESVDELLIRSKLEQLQMLDEQRWRELHRFDLELDRAELMP